MFISDYEFIICYHLSFVIDLLQSEFHSSNTSFEFNYPLIYIYSSVAISLQLKDPLLTHCFIAAVAMNLNEILFELCSYI